jgi:hypothetical protein
MKPRAVIIISVALILILFLIIWPSFRVHHLDSEFSKLSSGDTKAAVLKQMGSPWKNAECGYLVGSSPDCTEELIYAHPYAPYLPEYWIIDFNRDQRVIRLFYTTSP